MVSLNFALDCSIFYRVDLQSLRWIAIHNQIKSGKNLPMDQKIKYGL